MNVIFKKYTPKDRAKGISRCTNICLNTKEMFMAFLFASNKYSHALCLLQRFNTKQDTKQISPCTESEKKAKEPFMRHSSPTCPSEPGEGHEAQEVSS